MKFTSIITLLSLAYPGAVAFHSPLVRQATPVTVVLAAQMNGWTPDENEFAYGLPGKVAPFTGGFDPANFASRTSLDDMKTFRESEVTHGRVAMLAGMFH
jgi:Chlorophyll A-B binding protein